MLRLSLLGAVWALLAAATARPQTGGIWSSPSDGQVSGSVSRGAFTGQFVAPPAERGGFRPLRAGRRLADTVTNQLVSTTTTPKPSGGKKLVTLRPIGNNIQEILFNNGYRETPGEAEPQLNNIDNYDNLDGMDPADVWLLDGDLLVLKGGELSEGFIDTTPIDDYQAPYREPKFPPPGFNPDGILPPGTFGTEFGGAFGGAGEKQPEAFIPEFGYDPYGLGRGARTVLPPADFQYPASVSRPAQPAKPAVPRHTHEQVTYVKGRTSLSRPAGYITSLDSLPRSFSTSNSYPASAVLPRSLPAPAAFSRPASTFYDASGNYMTYTNHDGGFSYSYKTDGKATL